MAATQRTQTRTRAPTRVEKAGGGKEEEKQGPEQLERQREPGRGVDFWQSDLVLARPHCLIPKSGRHDFVHTNAGSVLDGSSIMMYFPMRVFEILTGGAGRHHGFRVAIPIPLGNFNINETFVSLELVIRCAQYVDKDSFWIVTLYGIGGGT